MAAALGLGLKFESATLHMQKKQAYLGAKLHNGEPKQKAIKPLARWAAM